MRVILASILMLLSATAARADGVHKDRERFDERAVVIPKRTVDCPGRPVRLTNTSPNYAGSEMGLGKPSYHGSRRPDPPE